MQQLQDIGVEWFSAFFNALLDSGLAPADGATSITMPIYKNKRGPAECTNYRPILLLSNTIKIVERIIDQRKREISEVTTNQCAFVEGSGDTDAVFVARRLMEKPRGREKTVASCLS